MCVSNITTFQVSGPKYFFLFLFSHKLKCLWSEPSPNLIILSHPSPNPETALPHLVVQVAHLVVQVAHLVFQVAHLVDTACSARVSAGGKVSYKEACARLGTEPMA